MSENKKGEKKEDPIVPGDIVSVNEEGLKSAMTPVALLKIGWPNYFCVTNVIEDATRGLLYELDPCCNWMVDWKNDGYPFLCRAHPARYFKKIEGKHVELPKGERYIGIGIGDREFVSVAPAANGKSAAAVLKFPGLPPVAIDGTEIKKLLDKLKGGK